MALTLVSAALLVLTSAISVGAESHTVKFDNRCGYGTPQLIKGGDVLTTTSYTSTGELAAAIAYLQTGSCGFNGEHCALLELTMTNPVAVGGGSSADISLIDPHTFSVPTRIEFYDGCDGIGTTCDSPGCNTAFKQPDDTWVQVACQDDNANLLITFCPDGSSSSSSNNTVPAQHSTTTQIETTSVKTSPTTSSTSVTHTSSPTTSALPRPSSTSMCKHNHSKRRAINAERRALDAHRKRNRNVHS